MVPHNTITSTLHTLFTLILIITPYAHPASTKRPTFCECPIPFLIEKCSIGTQTEAQLSSIQRELRAMAALWQKPLQQRPSQAAPLGSPKLSSLQREIRKTIAELGQTSQVPYSTKTTTTQATNPDSLRRKLKEHITLLQQPVYPTSKAAPLESVQQPLHPASPEPLASPLDSPSPYSPSPYSPSPLRPLPFPQLINSPHGSPLVDDSPQQPTPLKTLPQAPKEKHSELPHPPERALLCHSSQPVAIRSPQEVAITLTPLQQVTTQQENLPTKDIKPTTTTNKYITITTLLASTAALGAIFSSLYLAHKHRDYKDISHLPTWQRFLIQRARKFGIWKKNSYGNR